MTQISPPPGPDQPGPDDTGLGYKAQGRQGRASFGLAQQGLDWARLRARAAQSAVERVGKQRTRLTLAMAFGGAALMAVLSIFAFWQWAVQGLPRVPDAESLWALNRAPAIEFVDQTGRTLAIRGPNYGRQTSLSAMPDHLKNAFLAIEDRRFYEHRGVDRQGIMRAMWVNVQAGRIVQGGSTITQQLAKNLFLTPDQTARRKLQEMILAGRIENRLTKDEILELYLNRVDLGEQSFGVDAAARRYFSKPATDVTLAEAALLAGLPKAPYENAPTRNLPGAKQRQRLVLNAMVEAGFIDQAAADAAFAEPLSIAGEGPPEGELGYFFDLAAEQARRQLGDPKGESHPDLILQLTVDLAMQDSAVSTLRRSLGPLGRQEEDPLQGAIVVMDKSGAVRAMVGGTSYRASKFNRAAQALRQPGSAFKTFVYAAAFERGLDPEAIRYDEPKSFNGWKPRNYDEGYRGAMSLRSAFAHSINTIAAEVADEVGAARIADFARRLGITTLPANASIGLSISLGSFEVTLLDMTQSFAVFMNEGQRTPAHWITRIENSRGDVLWAHPQRPPPQIVDKSVAHRMNEMMGRVVRDGTAVRAQLPNRDVAGKTGTSQDWRDAWFVGYTADYTAGVWVGYDSSREMPRITGGGAPAEIWHDLMLAAHKDLPGKKLPGMTMSRETRRSRELSGFFQVLAEAFGKPKRSAQNANAVNPVDITR